MQQPYISAEKNLPELTFKAVFLSIILAIILSASNAYIGLKIGWIVSASIPAAVVAMVLFRLAKTSNILEYNIVQTGASASASVAPAIVFVIPAILLIKYWTNIHVAHTVFICVIGGLLGVLFSIPLRQSLLHHPELRFPEGRAIAEVLKANENSSSLKELFLGGLVGSVVQLCQQGFKVMASTYQLWFRAGKTVLGLGVGFDVTMMGAGFIMGFGICLSIFLGAILGWVFAIPILSSLDTSGHISGHINSYVSFLAENKSRYIGIGAMLVSGLWSLISVLKPIGSSLALSFGRKNKNGGIASGNAAIRTEKDIPMGYVIAGVGGLVVLISAYLLRELQTVALGLSTTSAISFFVIMLLYIIFAGFIFSTITAYFSGLLGVSASPVSAVNIAVLVIITLILNALMTFGKLGAINPSDVLHAAAFSILITAIIACAACVSNGTIQDLKTGEILGATPWKLQLILLIGVVVSTLVVPPVVGLLFNAYGIGNVFPHAGMNPAHALGAPQAAVIAAIAQGVFFHDLPFHYILIGAIISVIIILFNEIYLKPRNKRISVVALAVGMYLPMSATFPVFVGGVIALFVELGQKRAARQKQIESKVLDSRKQNTLLIACGLVAGGSIMGLLISIPVALKGSADVLSLVSHSFLPIAAIISTITTLLVAYWMYRVGTKTE